MSGRLLALTRTNLSRSACVRQGHRMSSSTSAAGKPKTIHLIRHAESEENVKIKSARGGLKRMTTLQGFIRPGELLNAAKLLSLELNAPLSQRGLEQLENMQETLAKDQFFQTSDIQLAVHSPLDRAIITCKTLLPRKPGSEDELAVPVLLNENLRERKPHEYVRKKSFYERINRFVDWLATREEERILLVGHGQHFKAMLKTEWKMANVQVCKATFDPKSREFSDVQSLYICPLADAATVDSL
mmetsp:Transcript_995/g.3529  ORF Transcript_995/g.3529 Transcript_995/m.3529 type:complete len:244 (-) Transcript_995:21-752(-)